MSRVHIVNGNLANSPKIFFQQLEKAKDEHDFSVAIPKSPSFESISLLDGPPQSLLEEDGPNLQNSVLPTALLAQNHINDHVNHVNVLGLDLRHLPFFAQFAICVLGIFGFFLPYGYIQVSHSENFYFQYNIALTYVFRSLYIESRVFHLPSS
jgi:hypothetical protein